MAPNKKKKKKQSSNPARGFTTVSTPSKRVDESLPESTNLAEVLILNGKHIDGRSEQTTREATENHAAGLQHMTPGEIETYLEDAELQSLLDTHGQSVKRDITRHSGRLETEKRNLRGAATVLEVESWLSEIVEDILDLARSPVPESKRTKASRAEFVNVNLSITLWTLQQTLLSLRLSNVDSALKHLVNTSFASRETDPIPLPWALDEAMSWLALHSDIAGLPSYQQEPGSGRMSPAFQSCSPPSTPTDRREYDDPDRETLTSALQDTIDNEMPETPENSTATATLDESDDDNPDELTDKFLSAHYELLERSLGRTGDFQEYLLVDRQAAARLKKRIERIERDVLFDWDEAMARWSQLKRHLETEYASRRASSASKTWSDARPTSSDVETFDCSSRERRTTLKQEGEEEEEEEEKDVFGNMFELSEKDNQFAGDQAEQAKTEAIELLDFGQLGAGANPRRVLHDFCQTKFPGCSFIMRQVSGSSRSYQHRAQILWLIDQKIPLSVAHLPAGLCYDFKPRLMIVTMKSVAAASSQQSEGYLATIVLFLLSEITKDEKISLRLQTVWRQLWRDLLEAKQKEIDSADKDALKHVQALIVEEMSPPQTETEEQAEQKAPHHRTGEAFNAFPTQRFGPSPEGLKSMWKEKASTFRYQGMLSIRQQLPISEYRERVLETIEAHQVTVLCAETGAGKSTQIPSFILEQHLRAGRDHCKILVTQPRRLSAISLARRVSEELGEAKSEIGTRQSLVGYAIRLENRTSPTTRITYVTTGVLLRMLESSKDLEECNFLLLDEVHERTMDLDLLFIAIRRLLKRRHDLRVVLMSATIDGGKFSEYFDNAPILNIPGRTFPVEIGYLEDAVELCRRDQNAFNAIPPVEDDADDDANDADSSERVKSLTVGLEKYSAQTRKVLAAYDEYRVDYGLIATLALAISSDSNLRQYSKAILIFMPGIAEIRRLHQIIMSLPTFQDGWVVHLLHSSFSTDDLEKAFERPPARYRKLVIATNIAETGITIPDVTAVIDTCREKIMRFDERRQLSKLTEAFVSRSSARQRRGRAARVQAGLCFHLVTRYRHDNLMLEHHVPEMLRLSLQDPILRIKVWSLGDVEETLKEAFDPPTSKNVRRAIQLLKDVKALSSTESLTSLGRQLAKLPLDIWLGKLVLYGVTFRCLDTAVFIAALLSAKSPFLNHDRSDSHATVTRQAFNRGNSDQLSAYKAYCGWRRACLAGHAHEFCRKNQLNHHTFSQIEDQKVQLLVNLSDTGLLLLGEAEKSSLRRSRLGGSGSGSGSSSSRRDFFMIPERYNLNSARDFAANSVIATALYPKILVREKTGWRNVSNNQQVNISPASINHHAQPSSSLSSSSSSLPQPPVKWLSFYQTMQTKSKNPTVFETSPVPEAAIVILLGEAEFRMYAGVILLDNGKMRFSVRDWKTMIALKSLRSGVQGALARSHRNNPSDKGLNGLAEVDARWLDIWQRIVVGRESSEGG